MTTVTSACWSSARATTCRPGSTIHHDPDRWYRSTQDDLSEEEVRWASTVGNITGRWYRAHTIYRAIQNEIARTLTDLGVMPDAFPLNHIAYCNYFLRPAPTAGGSMQGKVSQRDLEMAAEVLTWFILRHCPEMVIVTSRFAGRHAELVTRERGIPSTSTPHPGSRWWNTTTRSYGNVRGRDLFSNFLGNLNWATAFSQRRTEKPKSASINGMGVALELSDSDGSDGV